MSESCSVYIQPPTIDSPRCGRFPAQDPKDLDVIVAFRDESYRRITAWKWEFGDGTASTKQHPIHPCRRGEYIVTLEVSGPEGACRRAKAGDVVLKPAVSAK